MKEKIKLLISSGETKEALKLLATQHDTGLILQAQFNNGEKQFNLGVIDFAEWGRIQSRVNFAALELAGKLSTTTVIQNTVINAQTYVYVNFLSGDREPGTELGTTNKIFRAVERMIEDDDFPLADLEKSTDVLNAIIGLSELPELMTAFELFKTENYLNNTAAYQLKHRRAYAEMLAKYRDEITGAVREITTEKNKRTEWKEAWSTFISNPNFERWNETFPLIDSRITSAVFTDEVREMWGEMVADANAIPKGLTWKHKFTMNILPDLKKFINNVLLK